MFAELLEIELQSTPLPCLVGNLEESVHLMVYILDEFKVRERNRLELMQPLDVVGIPKQDCIGAEAVTAGTAGLLEVGLGAVGNVKMHHKAYIRLVDAHSEGVGAHHYPNRA